MSCDKITYMDTKEKANLKDFEAVVFDFDGTLVDSLGLWGQIDIEYLGRHGLEVPEGLSEKINGMSFTDTARYFKKRFGLTESIDQIKQDWIDLSHDHYLHDIPFKPGAKEFLETLDKKGMKIALATSNHSYTTEAYFNIRNIDCIDYFSYSCDAKMGKPAPYVFLNAAEGLDVKPSKCLAFEDTLEGVTAAKSAGMTVIAIGDKWSAHLKEPIKELADFYIKDYLELPEVLNF